MIQTRDHFFSLHELLMMAALAALGGVSSAVMSIVREMSYAVPGLGILRQCLSGIHVLWLVVALGLIRKPGAATVTGTLKGAVELLSGNPHGLLVIVYSAFGGLTVDAVWLLLRRRDHAITYMLSGGVGAASNVLVFALIVSLPGQKAVLAGVAILGGLAFVSGALLAGLLGWWLLNALRKAGVAGAQPHGPPIP